MEALAETKSGKTRQELSKLTGLGSGSVLSKDLEELEQCGFIRRYVHYELSKNNAIFQLTDPFVLFSLRFLKKQNRGSWLDCIHSPSYYAWRGNAFEICCLNHISQIKAALGISGVDTMEYAWRSKYSVPGAQIDLWIDRKDGIINLCEMKDTDEPFAMDKNEYEKLMNRLTAFSGETKTKKAIHLTLVSVNGMKQHKYASVFQTVVSGDDLFT